MRARIAAEDWYLTRKALFDTAEGPVYRFDYETESGLSRRVEQYCASYYCLESVSLTDARVNETLYDIDWGGASFPDADARSVIFAGAGGKPCLIEFQGNSTEYRDAGPDLVRQLQDARSQPR